MLLLKNIRQILIAEFTRSFLRGFSFLSLKNCHQLGAFLGWLTYIIPNRNRHVTKINVQLCFPDKSKQQQQELVKDSLIETGKIVAETSPMWHWEKEKLLGLIKNVKGEELLTQAVKNKKGVILAAPHLGNWEILGHYLADKYPTTCMYQKPKIHQLDNIIKNGRERLGVKLVPADGQGIRAMLKALKNNELICILPDQEPSHGDGVYAPFFKIKAYCMILVSRLAKKTDATALIIYSKRLKNGEGYEVVFAPLEGINTETVEESVNYLNKEIEKSISENPEQYQWSYKRFRTQPLDEKGYPTEDYYNS